MKNILGSIMCAIALIGFVGCTHTSETATTVPSNATAGQRTYSSQDLDRTGKRTSSEQLQAADPAVSTR